MSPTDLLVVLLLRVEAVVSGLEPQVDMREIVKPVSPPGSNVIHHPGRRHPCPERKSSESLCVLLCGQLAISSVSYQTKAETQEHARCSENTLAVTCEPTPSRTSGRNSDGTVKRNHIPVSERYGSHTSLMPLWARTVSSERGDAHEQARGWEVARERAGRRHSVVLGMSFYRWEEQAGDGGDGPRRWCPSRSHFNQVSHCSREKTDYIALWWPEWTITSYWKQDPGYPVWILTPGGFFLIITPSISLRLK